MKTIDFYLIRAISNLHVGSGEGDFSVVDKQVQRDPLTNLPTIHSSGIKGALREAMEYAAKNKENPEQIASALGTVTKIFGSAPKPEAGKIQQGLFNFFEGKLLALPIRSSHNFYYLASCPNILHEFIRDLEIFQPKHPLIDQIKAWLAAVDPAQGVPVYFGDHKDQLRLEDWAAQHHASGIAFLEPLLGSRFALLHQSDFEQLANQLPIIARNYLENGISNNLWYEEVVPREARFYVPIGRNAAENGLEQFLANQDHVVQIGANATVGYGLCKMTKI